MEAGIFGLLGRNFRWVRSLRLIGPESPPLAVIHYIKGSGWELSSTSPTPPPTQSLTAAPPPLLRRLGASSPTLPRIPPAVLRLARWFSHPGTSPPRRSAMSSGNAPNPHSRVHLFFVVVLRANELDELLEIYVKMHV